MANKRLKEKTAWITGSSRGIGRVVADHLASLGANVVVHGTTPVSTRAFGEADSLQVVADEIANKHGSEVLAVSGDLTDPTVVKSNYDEICKRFDHVDILINNAGGDIGSTGTSGPNAGKPLTNDAIEVSLERIVVV